jgi:hypothetical protein
MDKKGKGKAENDSCQEVKTEKSVNGRTSLFQKSAESGVILKSGCFLIGAH